MCLQKGLLLAAERPDQVGAFDSPAVQGFAGRFVLAEQPAIGAEAESVAIEQLVDMGGEQQAIGGRAPDPAAPG